MPWVKCTGASVHEVKNVAGPPRSVPPCFGRDSLLRVHTSHASTADVVGMDQVTAHFLEKSEDARAVVFVQRASERNCIQSKTWHLEA